MQQTDATWILLVITSPPTLESQLVDWLLSENGGTGFSSTTVSGHSAQHGHLSIAEQVRGQQKRLQFQVQIRDNQLDTMLAHLQAEFAGADLHYWVIPLLAGGHLG
jgi:hypothetical protein